MVTKLQAATAREFHACLHHICRRIVGPRGGVKVDVTHVRASGQCQTWVTRPNEFRLPIKHGLYTHASITEGNASAFHVADECPLAMWGSERAFVDALRDALALADLRASVADGSSAWAAVLPTDAATYVRAAVLALPWCTIVNHSAIGEILVNPVPGRIR